MKEKTEILLQQERELTVEQVREQAEKRKQEHENELEYER